MISNNKILSYIDRIQTHKPITADIFLNNFCNNRCSWCTYKRWQLQSNSFYMNFNDFVTYATKLRELGVEGFILTGGGQPTINPDFDKITQWLHQENLHWGINTNFNELHYIQPDYLKVSLDGWDEDSYSRIRGVKKYQQVRENIIKYSNWKSEASPQTSLGIQIVATNKYDIIKFYQGNKDLPVDYIVFRPVESTIGEWYKNKENNPTEILEIIDSYVEKDKRVIKNFKWNLLDTYQKDCTAQWAQIALNEKGQVIYCCHKPYEIIGHIMDDDILEKKEKAITNMSKCDTPCRMTAPNLTVVQIQQKQEHACFI